MTDLGTPDPGQPDPPSHPEVAVVVFARAGGEVLNAAVQALAEVSRAFGIEVLVLVPSSAGTPTGPGGLSLSVRLIAVDPMEDQALWRARTLTATGADILQFVDDRVAALVPWDEQTPLRLGIVRMDVAEPVDIRARLEHCAVPDPALSAQFPPATADRLGQPGAPLLSVIVPVSDGLRVLPRCLEALAASDLPRDLWELVVVDDGSLDGTSSAAAGLADILMRLPGPPRGPAYARNRGVEASLGAIVAFVDADVCVRPDALRRIVWAFARRPELGAVFGNYDANPPEPGDLSQYRNLRHHFVHLREAGDAETFWAGLGAVRRDAFVRAGRFDEWHFPRPQIEDVELGYRLRRLGYPILLDPGIEGTHLKRWRLKDIITADLRDRGVPWIRLQLTLGISDRPATLFFRRSEWVNSALVCLALVLLLLAARLQAPTLALIAGGLLGMVLILNHGLYRFFQQRRGLGFALRVMPLHLLFYLANGVAAVWAWMLFHLIGAPAPTAEVQAYAEKGLKTWPPQPTKASWVGGASARSRQ